LALRQFGIVKIKNPYFLTFIEQSNVSQVELLYICVPKKVWNMLSLLVVEASVEKVCEWVATILLLPALPLVMLLDPFNAFSIVNLSPFRI
jgi:hypothetical protein